MLCHLPRKIALEFFIVLLLCVAVAAQAHDRSMLFPGNHKYKNNGLQPATGRSGNAVLAVRALLGKDLVTTIELTTSGDFENPIQASGFITKVQEKVFDDTDGLLYTINHNGLGSSGYVVETSDSLVRHQPIQVQANIEGVDPGTDVVTLREVVKLRPDLSPNNLTAPPTARLNRTVVLNASVTELNGDVGAFADCVLYVNNGGGFTAVDSARHIWVDAGGTVGCEFNYAFPATGAIPVKVQVERVSPGDYDSSNDSVFGVVQVSDAIPIGGTASVTSDHRIKHYIFDDFSTSKQIMHVEGRNTTYQNTIQVVGHTNEAPGSFPFTLTYSEYNDSSLAYSSALVLNATSASTWSSGGYTYARSCGSGDDNTSNLTLYLCNEMVTYQMTGEKTYLLDLQYVRMPGEVTYHSDGFCTEYDIYDQCSYVQSYYSWNSTSTSSWAGFSALSLNTNYEVALKLASNDGAVFAANVVVPIIQTSTVDISHPYYCTTTSYGRLCNESDYLWVKTLGSTVF